MAVTSTQPITRKKAIATNQSRNGALLRASITIADRIAKPAHTRAALSPLSKTKQIVFLTTIPTKFNIFSMPHLLLYQTFSSLDYNFLPSFLFYLFFNS
jgi:hypothetical protein